MIVNPGIRRFLGSAIQRLFNSASFYAPLTHSAIPQRAASGTTGTFTRATTSTWPNNDGYMVTGVAGEIGFVGARRVRNLISTTNRVFTNAAWVNLGSPTAVMDVTGPFGDANSACTITDAEAGQTSSKTQTITVTGGAKLVFSCFVRKESSKTSYAAISLRHNVASTKISAAIIDQVAGTVFGIVTDGGVFETPVSTSIESYNSEFWRVSVTGVQAGATLQTIVSMHPAYSTNGTTFSAAAQGTAVFADAQLEDVTAQTTQTAGEYVSVGVPSDWAGDELVTNGTFDTDSDWTKDTGWAISGGVAAYDGSKGSNSTLNTVDTVFVAGQKYVISFDIVAISGNVNFATLAYTSGSYNSTGTKIAEYTHSGADSALYLNALDSGAATVTFDNISVKPAYYHGSFVDGVACFDYYYLD